MSLGCESRWAGEEPVGLQRVSWRLAVSGYPGRERRLRHPSHLSSSHKPAPTVPAEKREQAEEAVRTVDGKKPL